MLAVRESNRKELIHATELWKDSELGTIHVSAKVQGRLEDKKTGGKF